MRYLHLLQEGCPLESIVAITFTNAAAAEMRYRILTTLKRCALGQGTVEALNSRQAQELVAHILHDFSAMQVRTIDSLLFQIVRTASLYLKITPDVQPVFTTEDSLNPYLALVASKAMAGDADLAEDIRDVFTSLYREGDAKGFLLGKKIKKGITRLVHDLLLGTCDDLVPLKTLKDKRGLSLGHLRETAQNLLDSSHACSWMKRAKEAIDALARGDMTVLGSAYLSKERITQLFCKGSVVPNPCQALYETLKNQAATYQMMSDAIQTMPFITLGKAMLSERDSDPNASGFLYSEIIPALVLALFEGNLIPEDRFVTLGNAVEHVLIDEFQDTSDEQWMALAPLVKESLSKGGSLTWVGDSKQSIFSWRGGNPDLFDGILDPTISDLTQCVDSADIHRETLPNNYRSCEALIAFCGTIFAPCANEEKAFALARQSLPDSVPDSVCRQAAMQLKTVFADVAQTSMRNDLKGFVAIDVCQEEEVLETLGNSLERLHASIPWSDMLVLARTNEQCQEIANAMSMRGIPCMTENSLLLAKQGIVVETVAFMRFVLTKDPLALWTVLSGSIVASLAEDFSLERFVSLSIAAESYDPVALFMTEYPSLWQRFFAPFVGTSVTAYDLVSEWYACMRVEERFPESRVFLRRFLEVCYLAETKNNATTISDFLEYWDTMNDGEKIPMPERMDAVRIMTIHKSKGLEAAHVLLPWKMQKLSPDPKLCFVTTEDGARIARFSSKKTPEITHGEYLRLFLEAVHLLYVAITRARDALHILRIPVQKESTDILLTLLSYAGIDLPAHFGEEQTHERDDAPFVQKASDTIMPDSTWTPMAWLPPIKILHADNEQASIAQKLGILVHHCLEYFLPKNDPIQAAKAALHLVVQRHQLQSFITKEMQTNVVRSLVWFAEQPQAKYWLEKGLREQSIKDASGSIMRCDLIVPANPWVVVDYKSGEPNARDQNQIRAYIQTLSSSLPSTQSCLGVLVYLEHARFQIITTHAASPLCKTVRACQEALYMPPSHVRMTGSLFEFCG